MNAPQFLAPVNERPHPTVTIADSLAAYEDATTGQFRCRVGEWADNLPDGELDLLRPHIRRGNIKPLYTHLKRDGINLPYSATSWERHWTGRCPCTTPETSP